MKTVEGLNEGGIAKVYPSIRTGWLCGFGRES